ncbi:hypothetical protein DAETH_27680 [Deinococcus aetherius]|uniref:Uncharacterized protein n=1 Tax=Deinococcus aetherius TaxID=200252 RepID=A0ABM8AGE8_9DEIO|nr:hypothetical protein [Deinococcus aetherius]BDP42799.1 hypothetical protein DAETH_27680 [Deinococcus aetherius]
MNEQLRQTLQALGGGVTNVDPSAAATVALDWQQTLTDVPGAATLADHLAQLQGVLSSGDLEEAARLLPALADETERLAANAPAEDQDGLRQLAALLRG